MFVKRHIPLHAVHSLLWTATVLENLFRECHLSSATLGQKHPEVTKHPLGHTWSEAPAVGINHCLTQNTNESCSCRMKILTMERLRPSIVGPDGKRFTSTVLRCSDNAGYSLVKAFPLLALNIALVYLVLLRFFMTPSHDSDLLLLS